MEAQARTQNSIALLERMATYSEKMLKILTPAERISVEAELRTLADRAGKVRTEADLLYVADETYQLVKGTPALAALLLTRRRSIRPEYFTGGYDTEDRKAEYAQAHAAQIRNHVVACRDSLERALEELPWAREGY